MCNDKRWEFLKGYGFVSAEFAYNGKHIDASIRNAAALICELCLESKENRKKNMVSVFLKDKYEYMPPQTVDEQC